MQVSKWGNTLAIRLPASVVEVVIGVFKVRKKTGKETIFSQLRQFRGKLPADFKFDRDDANARS